MQIKYNPREVRAGLMGSLLTSFSICQINIRMIVESQQGLRTPSAWDLYFPCGIWFQYTGKCFFFTLFFVGLYSNSQIYKCRDRWLVEAPKEGMRSRFQTIVAILAELFNSSNHQQRTCALVWIKPAAQAHYKPDYFLIQEHPKVIWSSLNVGR